MGARILLLALCWGASLYATSSYAFKVNHVPHLWHQRHQPIRRGGRGRRSSLGSSSYGKGADIWPPTNEESPVKLSDSFPNGVIPPNVALILEQAQQRSDDEQRPASAAGGTTRTNFLPRRIDRILRGAATAEEETSSSISSASNSRGGDWDRVLAVVALGLIRYLDPRDGLVLLSVSGYLCLLTFMARSLRSDGITPCLPALPPQGHVPAIFDNPLGYDFTYSVGYGRWLNLGVGLGLVAPLLWLVKGVSKQAGTTTTPAPVVLAAGARPVFFLCAQALTEATMRRNLTPLPLRILVPVLYNALRLGYLWQWLAQVASDRVGLILAIANLVYLSMNLFGFLLPIAVPRYLRAHILGVEVEQVTTRQGMEDSALGFSPAPRRSVRDA